MRIDIDPIPAPRPRARAMLSKDRKKAFAHIYNPSEYTDWLERFVNALPVDFYEGPIATPVHVYVECVVQRPKTTKLLTPRGDIDNYVKAVLDGLTDANVWEDDTLVESLRAKKRFTREGESAHIVVEIGQE